MIRPPGRRGGRSTRGVPSIRDPVRDFARKYWFDLLIAFLAAAAMLEVIATRDSTQATRWFGLPAIAIPGS